MKLRMIIETVQDQLTTLAGGHKISPEEVRSICQKISKKRWKWVLIQWYDGKISLPEDEKSVATALSNFEEVFSRLPADKNNIMQYQSLKEVEETVNPLVGIVSSKKKHKFEGLEGVKVVNENGPYVTVEVTDPESLGALGEGTKWCTRNSFPDCQKNRYINDHGHIFIVFQNGRPVMQYTPDYQEIKDVDDEDVTDEKLLSLLPSPELKEGNEEAMYEYALNVVQDRWSEAEPYIMQDPIMACNYARYVMNRKRWPEAEPYIAEDPYEAYWYARNIMKEKRFPEAELYIMKDPALAYLYARDIMKGKRWSEAEPYIMKDPEWAVAYAHRIMKKRWPEAEEYIMKNPFWARRYSDHFNLDWDV